MSADAVSGAGQDRLAWIDRARGVGIILVVLGHVISGLIGAHVEHPTPVLSWTNYLIYLFHMPVFFFLSGLVVQGSLNRGPSQFLLGKIWTVAFPYILWSLVHAGLKLVVARDVNTPPPSDLLGALLWDPFDHFWFLYALMSFHLLALLFNGRRLLLLGFAIATSILAWAIPDAVWDPDDILHKIARNDIFFAAGAFLAPYLLNKAPPVLKHRALWAPALWIAFGAAAVWGAAVTDFDRRAAGAFPAIALGVTAFLVSIPLIQDRLGRALTWLGEASMVIFILHVWPSAAFRIGVNMIGVDLPLVAHIVIGTIVGLAGPAVVYIVLKRLNWLHWFGLGPPPRALINAILARRRSAANPAT